MRELKTNEYFKALYPDELVARFRAGERDFEGINLLRAELESILGPTVVPFDSWYLPASLSSGEMARGPACPLWADRWDVEPRFEWDRYGRFCPVELDDLPETKDLAGVDLRGINLSSAYLYPIDLSGADLTGAILRRCTIIDGRFSGTECSRADFRDASLGGADLTGAKLYMARLDRCSLAGAVLRGVSLIRAKLRKASLAGSDLTGASITNARFDQTSLFGACLKDVDLESCDFSSCFVGGLRISPNQRDEFLRALRTEWQP